MSDDPSVVLSSPAPPLTPEQKLALVRDWQSAGFVHELTCANDSKHPPLVPKLEDGLVVCECPLEGCGFRQSEAQLPKDVFSDYVADFRKAMDGRAAAPPDGGPQRPIRGPEGGPLIQLLPSAFRRGFLFYEIDMPSLHFRLQDADALRPHAVEIRDLAFASFRELRQRPDSRMLQRAQGRGTQSFREIGSHAFSGIAAPAFGADGAIAAFVEDMAAGAGAAGAGGGHGDYFTNRNVFSTRSVIGSGDAWSS